MCSIRPARRRSGHAGARVLTNSDSSCSPCIPEVAVALNAVPADRRLSQPALKFGHFPNVCSSSPHISYAGLKSEFFRVELRVSTSGAAKLPEKWVLIRSACKSRTCCLSTFSISPRAQYNGSDNRAGVKRSQSSSEDHACRRPRPEGDPSAGAQGRMQLKSGALAPPPGHLRWGETPSSRGISQRTEASPRERRSEHARARLLPNPDCVFRPWPPRSRRGERFRARDTGFGPCPRIEVSVEEVP